MPDTQLDATTDTLETVNRLEEARLLRVYLPQLPWEMAIILICRYSLAWPAKKIAVALKCSPAAVDMKLTRARRGLANILPAHVAEGINARYFSTFDDDEDSL